MQVATVVKCTTKVLTGYQMLTFGKFYRWNSSGLERLVDNYIVSKYSWCSEYSDVINDADSTMHCCVSFFNNNFLE